MNVILNKLSAKVISSAEDKGKIDKYTQMQGTDGWKVHQEYLLYLRGLMAETMLSESFTTLPPYDKDVCQRAYALVDQAIMFLLDPLAKARKLNVYAAHNARMEATVRGATERKTK